ncbi:MAG: T9SS type A sorting domain-containing protein, partial [Chitinophagales bacterium]
AQNNIYIGCNLGLIKFDGLNWILFTTSNSGISNNNVTDVEYDASTGKIYTATGAAVDIYDGTDWTHFNSSNSPLSSSGIWSVDARNDSMIVTTIGGSYLTYIFDGANWITHPEMDHTYDSRIDLQGNFWICGIGFIEKYDGNSWTTYTRYNTGLTSYFMNSVFVDSKDRKWFGVSDNGGISMFDCPVWEDYGAWNSGLWPAPITMATSGTSATEDTFGNVWMSYYAGGIVKIPEGDVHNYPAWVTWQAGAVPNATCKLIAADNSGDVWAEGGCGLAIRYDHVTGEWIQYNLYDMGLPCGSNNYMYSIKPNPNNNEVWFCTQAGIAIYDAGTWTIKSQSNGGLPFQGEYYDVAFDSQNNAWVASDDGLIKLTGATWTIYNESNSPLIANHINSLTIDADNLLYLSTSNVTTFPYYGGINTFDGMNNWQSYAYGSSPLPHYQLGQVALDKLGNLWINSASEGVIIFNSNGVQGWECIDTSLETGIATGIVSVGNELSTIAKCYPNPFLSTTTFEFNLAKTGNVSISIADITGREVKKIVTQNLPAGNNKAVADLSELESGIYICIIKAGEKIQTIKLVKN